MASHSLAYRADIDGLRTIAVASVVLFHAGAPVPGGFSGVDVFFVISGFLITRILWRDMERERFSLLAFYERRARRILPALWAMLAAVAVAALVWMVPHQVQDLGAAMLATVAFVANVLFAHRSGYFAPDEEFNPLLHMWSLAVEEQFYLVFPLLLVAAFKLRQPGHRVLLVAVPVLAVFGWLYAKLDPTAHFYASTGRAWELGVGALLAFAPAMPRADADLDAQRGAAWRLAGTCLGAAMLAASFVWVTPQTPWPGPYTLLPVLGTALMIGCAHPTSPVTRLLAWEPMVALGKLSYALYLWHWPIFAFLRLRSASTHLAPIDAAAGTALALLCAYASWRWVERPTRDRDRFSQRRVAALAVGGALAFAATGAGFMASSGLPSRIDAPTEALLRARFDHDVMFKQCDSTRAPDPGAPECHIGPHAPHADQLAPDAQPPALPPPAYALWGDSHAPSARRAVEAAMNPQPGALWWTSSCPALLGVHLVDHPSREGCAASRQRFIAWLDAHPEVHTVVIAGRWLPAFGAVRETGGSYRLWIEDAHTTEHSVRENLAVLQRGVERTVARLRASHKRVVLLGGIPEFGINAPTILALAQHNGAQVTPSRPTRDVEREYAPIDAIFQAVAARDPHTTFIPIWRGLCGDVTCHLIHQGAPIFFDDDHLSLSAAQHLLAPFLHADFPADRHRPPPHTASPPTSTP